MSEKEHSEQVLIIYQSLRKKPVDEDSIANILINTTNKERQIIRSLYKNQCSIPIQIDLKDKLNYKFKDLCINMFDTLYEYDARELHRALHSFLNDDKLIIEIMVSRPKSHLDYVNKAYQNFYKISLKDEIKNETSGDYMKFLSTILETERPINKTITEEEAIDIANSMNKRGLKEYGKDIELFRNIFLLKSREDLILISRAYNDLFNKSLYDAIDNDVNGKNRGVLREMLFAVISPAEWYSKKIFNAIEGLGTDTYSLNRALIGRAEIDMKDIRDFYYIHKGTLLRKHVEGDTSGAYGKVMVALSEK